ncbi:diguanylate cyclase [Varunaivibrio sulfuroxidans]|uniref:diguanylate cyclase n=1 Tax=Varunaivibrio sulfuroxidans TaxID=1773489 RepID=A0A4R3JDF5_9PROT|nr:diguanylate cyclase [Varunaivibrio sulfuroxidans]TCS64038.1 response regulator receiver modulated diguanylate cyclase [Varunaivibrio sulfuroxidans]WES31511.1 diguanylate cyclase [Varunaivibrio sulfuroxidans]
MADEETTVQSRLDALRASYGAHIPGKVAAIKSSFDAVFRGETLDMEAFGALRHLTHQLSGSAATFGYPVLGKSAREIERLCNSTPDGETLDSESVLNLHRNIEKHIVAIERDGTAPLEGKDRETEITPVFAAAPENRKRIFVLTDSEEFSSRTRHELAAFGFEVTITLDMDVLIRALDGDDFDVFIIDSDFSGDEHPGIAAVERARERAQSRSRTLPPIVLSTDRSDLHARIKAVRAGIEVYLSRPLDFSVLVDVLDRYTDSQDVEPYRILVLDDEVSLARYSELILQGAGMICRALSNPMDFLEAVEDFSPELILMDLYMPGIDGEELATALRQNESFAGIPIVFLSGEADLDKQLMALKQGGDDFLTKPVTPEYLISSVKIRVQRFRRLRMLMARDSMTGLYNHTTTKQLLQTEVSRAERDRSTLVLASLDIDHFKRVNDTYGHGVGDNVIKSLSRLLRQRLRGVDIIGRMGGEEFAVIMPDTLGIHAKGVFEDIRNSFSSIEHHAREGNFSVTISCGIAEFPKRAGAAALSDAADRALYAAKHNGRDQVVLD